MQRKRFGDLPRSARIYVTCVALAGACTAIHAFYQLISQAPKWDWTILAVLTLVSGSATVRVTCATCNVFGVRDIRRDVGIVVRTRRRHAHRCSGRLGDFVLGVLPEGPAVLQVGFQRMCSASFRVDLITFVLLARGDRSTSGSAVHSRPRRCRSRIFSCRCWRSRLSTFH